MDNHMKYCQGCKFVRYCSERCQKAYWDHGHIYTCADIKKEFHYIDLRKTKQVFYGYISQVTLATWMELLADVTESFNSWEISV